MDHKGNVFLRKLNSPLPMAVRAYDVWIEDDRGNRFLDASGGPLVVNLGHGREEIAKAVRDQILGYDYTHPTMFTTPVVEALARSLAAHAPPGIDRFYFMSGGAEAVETAIKLARQIHLEHGRSQRFQLISRWKSYHGLTLGALAASGRSTFRAPYAPMLTDACHIPAPYCLRCAYGLDHPACGLRCARALEEAIENLGPETVSAFIAETVSGATIAAVTPPPGYFALIREICDRYEVMLILDEVLCGMGRTGRWFAAEHYDVVPDLITMGKGLGGGAVALSAVGVQGKHFEAICKGTGQFVHGGTFSHHNVAAAAGNAVIGILEREKLVQRADRVGHLLGETLKRKLAGHPHVADIRGIGLLWGIEIVENKTTLKPYPRTEKVTERLWENLFEQGVLAYKSTGLAGTHGDAILYGPPFIISEEQIQFITDALAKAVDSVLGE
jgi:adenosylmethionine-8-amino-7-oxononanoate aminotransferase